MAEQQATSELRGAAAVEESARKLLLDPERFSAYRAEVERRLVERAEARSAFLTAAEESLAELLRRAERLQYRELEQELGACLAAAREERLALAALLAGPPGAAETLPRAGPTPVEERIAAPPGPPPAADLPSPAPLPPTPSEPDPAPAAPAPPPQPPSPTVTAPNGAGGAAPVPAPAEPVALAPVRKSPPARVPRAWDPRPVAELSGEVDRLAAAVAEPLPEGEAGMLRLKVLLCCQRRTASELEARLPRTGETDVLLRELRDLHGILRDKAQACFPDRYVPPLSPQVSPSDPAHWQELAEGYELLAVVVEALPWFDAHAGGMRAQETAQLLDGMAAAQQWLYRVLEERFRGARDDQQRPLYERMIRETRERNVYLGGLNPDQPFEPLLVAARRFPEQFQRLKVGVARKVDQRQAIARVLELTEHPSFDARGTALRDAAAACLKSGLPASNKEVRDALLPWRDLLADDPSLARLIVEIDRERERRVGQQSLADTEDDAARENLGPAIQELLRELLPHTRGKRCLFIGGDPRDEKRRELEEVLGLAELAWPSTRKTASPYDFEPEIARCDMAALLVRFMRTGFKQAADFCEEHDTRLVWLPRGLGLTRVITDFHEQLVPRQREGSG